MSAVNGRHLTLAVPGIFGPAAANSADDAEGARLLTEGLSLGALERFFSRSAPFPTHAPEPGVAAMLFACFGVARQGADWPVAAVTRSVDGSRAHRGWWLRADPVHLRAGMGELVLTDSADLRISADEAVSLAGEINAHMSDSRLRLEPLAAKRWYLRLDEAPRLSTRTPWEVIASPIAEQLPGGEDAAYWHARINEIQMILNASPVNRARERHGQAPINSLWLWGGGHAPQVPTGCWQGVWTDETLAAGLALLGDAPSRALPGDARAWLADAASPGHHLLVVSAGYVPARSCDAEAWRRFISEFEEVWMAPLLDALGAGLVHSISVLPGGARGFRLIRRQLRRWWRRPAPFARSMASSRSPPVQPK